MSDDVKKVIMENPDLPIVYNVSEDCISSDYSNTINFNSYAYVTKLLGCKVDEANGSTVCLDEEELYNEIREYVVDKVCNKENCNEEYVEKKTEEIMDKYRNKWIDVICICIEP